MRRVPLLVLLALIAATPAFALTGSADDGTLSVKRGRGYVGLNFNGAAIGSIARGKVSVDDPIDGDGAGVDFYGCETERPVTDTKTICAGEDIRFRAIGGKYRIRVYARNGLYLTAVGTGLVRLNGNGDDTDRPDGVYSFNDEEYQSLPDEAKDFPLAAPAQG
jgi:hypothetical protein